MTVGEYIRTAAALPWDWGGLQGDDCCTFMAGWVIECGHRDPMAFIRGSYDSELSAIRRIKEGGGLVPLWERGLAESGVPIVGEAHEGDIGIIGINTEDAVDEACAICVGPRWVMRWTSGMISTPATPLRVWRP